LITSMRIPLAGGATVVLMDGWDAEQTLSLIERHRVTHTHMVPTMFHRLLALPDEVKARYDLSSLRFAIHGAAPCPLSVKRAMIDWWGPIVWEYYGATEGMASVVDSHDWLQRPGTVGKPPGTDHVIVLDEAGEPCAPGEVGAIFIRSSGAGFSYHKDSAKTEGAFRGDHFTLGDVGFLDEDGFLFLTDRSVDLIICGGVNVYPAAVEARLLEHPAVRDAAVIGVPSEEWGEEVKAVVELEPGGQRGSELEEALIAFCSASLAKYQCPRSVDFVSKLPRQDNGKLYKQRLREAYREADQS
ncbi:MAG: AMP-binding protein, partial [bacterium]|nr:AMP-binding protein [bacterium]